MGKKKSSASTIIATAIVALAAIAAIIVLIVMSKESDSGQKPSNGSTVENNLTQEFIDECGENAQTLVAGNYRIVRLFISEGLPHRDEPYGNKPEDGYYTVESDEFKTYEQIDTYVRSIFTTEETTRILLKMPFDPAEEYGTVSTGAAQDDTSSRNLVPVYWPRVDYVDAGDAVSDAVSDVSVQDAPEEEDGENDTESRPSAPSYVKQYVLGINEKFKPYTDYKKPWGSISIKIAPVSEEECDITIYLGADKDVDLSSVDDDDILHTKMVKENGEWRLTQLVF